MNCSYCGSKAHVVRNCKKPLRERPIQEILTRREYNIFLRFGIGPAETPTPKEAEEFKAVMGKIRKERRRQKQAMRRFLASAEKALNKYGESLYGKV